MTPSCMFYHQPIMGSRTLLDQILQICFPGTGIIRYDWSSVSGATVTDMDDREPFNKSHNAIYKYSTMHHLVTIISRRVDISDTKWCIGGYGTAAWWDLCNGSIDGYQIKIKYDSVNRMPVGLQLLYCPLLKHVFQMKGHIGSKMVNWSENVKQVWYGNY